MFDYFTNKSKHRLIVKNKHKYMAIYYKNRNKKGKNANRSIYISHNLKNYREPQYILLAI